MTDEMMKRRGTASEAAVTVRALAFMIAGPEPHHVAMLQEKYLSTV